MPRTKYYQGKFRPLNPKKYAGNADNICYRSGWEFRVMANFDKDPDVIQWSSEEISIKYWSPVDKRFHRYFPDFLVKKKTPQGVKVFMIEVKPLKETRPPKQSKTRRKTLLEAHKYTVNQAKWKAAEEYCKRQGITFQVITEKELGIK